MIRPGPGASRRCRGRGLGPGLIAALACVIGLPAAQAETVFQWVDERGLLHLSDRPPPVGVERMQRFATPSYAPLLRAQNRDPGAILDHAERLAEDRRQRERDRAETRRREREHALRQREIETRRYSGRSVYAPVVVHPRRLHHPHPQRRDLSRRTSRPRSLWEPEHPVYRSFHRPRPATPRRSRPSGIIPAPR